MTASGSLTWRLVLPGPLERLTGGTIYDRRMVEGARAQGDRVEVISLSGNYPQEIQEVERAAARSALFGTTVLPPPSESTGPSASSGPSAPAGPTAPADGALGGRGPARLPVSVIDGLVLATLRDELCELGAGAPWIALVHHPVSEEPGLPEDRRAAIRDAELAALGAARGVICTSAFTARVLEAAGVPAERIRVVEPGVDIPTKGAANTPARPRGELQLLCVANLMERKGLDVLFAALGRVRREWRLTLVGSAEHEPKTAATLAGQAKRLGIADRITTMGTVASDRLTDLYRSADLFVFPSRYEGYGMVLTEAAAHGLPIVTTNGGAIPDTVRDLTAEVVPVDDADRFAKCVQRYLDDMEYRAARRAAAEAAVTRLTRWDRAVARFRDAIRECATS